MVIKIISKAFKTYVENAQVAKSRLKRDLEGRMIQAAVFASHGITSAFPHRLLITLCITLGRELFSAVVMGGFIGLPADWAGTVSFDSMVAERESGRRPVEGAHLKRDPLTPSFA